MASTFQIMRGRTTQSPAGRVAYAPFVVCGIAVLAMTLLPRIAARYGRSDKEVAVIRAAAARSPEARQLVGTWISVSAVDGRKAGYTFHPDGTGTSDWYDAASGRMASASPINWWRSSETLTVEDAEPSKDDAVGPQTYKVRISPDGQSVVVGADSVVLPMATHASTVYIEVPMRRVK